METYEKGRPTLQWSLLEHITLQYTVAKGFWAFKGLKNKNKNKKQYSSTVVYF